ncbi:MAG TPA: acyltransferase family protein [Micromonosporaceae bacterium]
MSGTGGRQGLRYAPGLDGVRALAVFAVVAYHIGTTSAAIVLPGGYLGVDVFFVLSGYLITSLLIVERRQTGHISIKNFYIRRARRLLPALYMMLLVVAAVGAFWLPAQAPRLKGDLLASLGYFQNWWLIGQHSSYFASAGDRPPMLTHLWSLAVEEQYYLVWPVILIAFAVVRARQTLVLMVVLAGVAASAVTGLLLYDPNVDPSRVYYGTDTRALAPLLGAALAIAVKPWLHRSRLPWLSRLGLDVIGVAALVLLVGIARSLADTDERLYRGGFLIIAVLAAGLVGVAGHPGTTLGRLLGMQPLRYLGERSYAIYLWHWPVCLVTRPGVDISLTGWSNAALRIAIAVILAEISYHLIERPIRRHGFLAALRRPRPVPVAGSAAAAVARGPALPLAGRDGRPRDPDPTLVLRPGTQTLARRPRAHLLRTAALTIVLVAGGAWTGFGLTAAASHPVAGGPVDTGADQSLGALTTATPEPSSAALPYRPYLPKGATVAFFGDSQGMTLLLNKPANLSQYIHAVDDTIEGCGVLRGKIASRSGERRTLNCDWQPIWHSRVTNDDPDLSVIMIGAWDVFDLTLSSGQKLAFGSPEWDQNFRGAIVEAIDTLLSPGHPVGVALLPCYRPIPASLGTGSGYWPERGDDQRTRHVNDVLRLVAATYPTGVFTIDPPAQFCTDPIASDLDYRWDGLHFYKKGAALYFQTILPQFLAPEPSATPTPAPPASSGSAQNG